MTLTPIAASLIMLAHTMTATYMGVDPEKVPPVKGAYTLPYKNLKKVCVIACSGRATGVYISKDQKIYLGKKWYYDDEFIFSQLLHETVHHFQRHANIKRNCHNAEEITALEMQANFLKTKGKTWVNDIFDKAKAVYKNGKCY